MFNILKDIGYGSAENQKSKCVAFEKAKKEAVTDGMKRSLRIFGNRLGNCAYDKNFLKQIKLMGANYQKTGIPKHHPVTVNTKEINRSEINSIAKNDNLNNEMEGLIKFQVPPKEFSPKWQPASTILKSDKQSFQKLSNAATKIKADHNVTTNQHTSTKEENFSIYLERFTQDIELEELIEAKMFEDNMMIENL